MRLILRRWREADREPFAALNADPLVMEQGGAPFIGFVGLSEPTFTAHFAPAVEIGWRLGSAFWGKGYATEAAAASLAFGFGSLELDEIVSFAVPDNVRSLRVMERLGMAHDSTDDFDHPCFPAGHRCCRHVLYRISRARWAETRRLTPQGA